MDLGIRFLSYEVVAAPETPTGLAVMVQRAQIMPQLSTRTDNAQVWPCIKLDTPVMARFVAPQTLRKGASNMWVRNISSCVTIQASLSVAAQPAGIRRVRLQ
jgi:hypothetical protein